MKPNAVPHPFDCFFHHALELCWECAWVAQRQYTELFVNDKPDGHNWFPFREQPDVDIKPNFVALRDSAESGCAFCKFVLMVII